MPVILRDLTSRKNGVTRRQVPHLVFACPKVNANKSQEHIAFGKGKGYTNTYSHLRFCLSDGSEDHRTELYQEAHIELRSVGIQCSSLDLVPSSIAPQSHEKSIHAYLPLVVKNNYPMSNVQNAELQNFSRYKVDIGRNDFRAVMVGWTRRVGN